MTTIYKAKLAKGSNTTVEFIEPHSLSRYGQNLSVVTDCLTEGSERIKFSPGVTVKCVDGKQEWTGYYFPGLLTDPSKVDFDYSVQGKWKVPVNMHVGEASRACPSLLGVVSQCKEVTLVCIERGMTTRPGSDLRPCASQDAWAWRRRRSTTPTLCRPCPTAATSTTSASGVSPTFAFLSSAAHASATTCRRQGRVIAAPAAAVTRPRSLPPSLWHEECPRTSALRIPTRLMDLLVHLDSMGSTMYYPVAVAGGYVPWLIMSQPSFVN